MRAIKCDVHDLEPANDLAIADFIATLPSAFQHPVLVEPLGEIGGVVFSSLRDGDWALAWRLVGESSEWVLSFLETHTESAPIENLTQFMHFITNAMGMGGSCRLVIQPERSLPF